MAYEEISMYWYYIMEYDHDFPQTFYIPCITLEKKNTYIIISGFIPTSSKRTTIPNFRYVSEGRSRSNVHAVQE